MRRCFSGSEIVDLMVGISIRKAHVAKTTHLSLHNFCNIAPISLKKAPFASSYRDLTVGILHKLNGRLSVLSIGKLKHFATGTGSADFQQSQRVIGL